MAWAIASGESSRQDDAGLAVPDQLGQSADGRHDHRHLHPHHLQSRDAERLAPAGDHTHVEGPHDRRRVLVQAGQDDDPVEAQLANLVLQMIAFGSVADHEETPGIFLVPQDCRRFDEQVRPFGPVEPADEPDDELVLTEAERLSDGGPVVPVGIELLQVDEVGND